MSDARPWTGPLPQLPGAWNEKLARDLDSEWFRSLWGFVQEEREQAEVFPPESDVFSALALTPPDKVRVVLLGQDPYHDVGQAHGLCFSVRKGVKPPPSLVNMFKELQSDLGIAVPDHGCLDAWAKQGVLLLNAVLTVRAHEPNSHKDRGWEKFTDLVIEKVNEGPHPVVFALWGAYAQKKAKLVDASRHAVIKAAHPSPLSVKQFSGSRPFSKINEALQKQSKPPIDWRL